MQAQKLIHAAAPPPRSTLYALRLPLAILAPKICFAVYVLPVCLTTVLAPCQAAYCFSWHAHILAVLP